MIIMSVESEQNEVQDESEIVTLAHQMGLKVYYCKGVICIADHCKKGRELKAISDGGQQYIKMDLITDYPKYMIICNQLIII